MGKSSLPLSSKRRQPEVEILDYNRNEVSDNTKFKQDITTKALDSLPQMLNIAQSIVDIKKMKTAVDGQVQLLREKGELLNKETDAFVKRETANRDTLRERGSQVQNLLRDLYLNLNHMNCSDEVQKVLIETVNQSIDRLLSSGANK
ncbi:hypothetical protein P5G62_010985 [Neobacillus sp. 179-C4.2 HS]|uniref:Uncharacterized protein n=1 Tax=Neobacillus driksii TaxID=3035913 RepID=A0ABV4YU61_9BACI|nr:hypothetical protein [Neobacillus sp. 179.-C4.2 HS]MDP5194248.1 hypothetical protein [Neobacillus sp. 179.-C4.2 HS]